jgi:hypothetical protein
VDLVHVLGRAGGLKAGADINDQRLAGVAARQGADRLQPETEEELIVADSVAQIVNVLTRQQSEFDGPLGRQAVEVAEHGAREVVLHGLQRRRLPAPGRADQ